MIRKITLGISNPGVYLITRLIAVNAFSNPLRSIKENRLSGQFTRMRVFFPGDKIASITSK